MNPQPQFDPGTGTTPTEYLDAVREDVGGTTLRRITCLRVPFEHPPLAGRESVGVVGLDIEVYAVPPVVRSVLCRSGLCAI